MKLRNIKKLERLYKKFDNMLTIASIYKITDYANITLHGGLFIGVGYY